MNHWIVRTKSEEEGLIQRLKKLDKPYKVYFQEIFPHATVDQYSYLFGVLYKEIGKYMGEPDIQEVHKIMLSKFNIEYAPLPHNPLKWELRIKRGREFDVISISEYIDKLCAWIHAEYGGSLSFPKPNEVWHNKE